jgi:pimeloyl-ACP methyl ester carboxylesterase
MRRTTGRTALPLLRRALALLTLLAATAGAAAAPDLRETRIAEPVFGGEAVVYEAGLGRARSIVLVHGLGSSALQDYGGMIEWLARDFHVVAFDLPGFGASSRQNAAYTPQRYAAFVRHVAAGFVRRPFVLVGHSMGGLVALRYAGTYPEDVERLVVADVPGVLHRLSYTSRLAASGTGALLRGVPLPAERIEALARRLLGLVERMPVDLAAALEDPEQRQLYFEGVPERIAAFAVAAEDPRPWLPKVVAPTLVVWGADDPVAPPRTARLLAERIAGSRFLLLDGIGHTPMLEAPEAFREAVQPFAREGRWPMGARAAAPPPAASPASESAACRDGQPRRFEGHFEALVLENCHGVTVRGSRLRHLRVINSSVRIEGSRLGGIELRSGTVEMTGGRLEAPVPIEAEYGHLDLAGVDIAAGEAVARSNGQASLVCSLCRIDSPAGRREMHRYVTVTPERPLR